MSKYSVILCITCLASVDASRTKSSELLTAEGDVCSRVKGATSRKFGGLRMEDCECPAGLVITGESPSCKAAENSYSRFFASVSSVGVDGTCTCAFKSGCGLVKYDVDDVIPVNAAKKGMPPPVIVGTAANIDTGIPALDAECFGLWWMKDNPVPEEVASMAGAFSEYAGQNLDISEVNWADKVVMQVPNSRHNHWAWPDSFAARKFIMPTYTAADPKGAANNFTMQSATYGEISTALTDMPGVRVDKWTFEKIDPDHWLRRTCYQKRSLVSKLKQALHAQDGDCAKYTLTRIADEQGTPTKYFQEFKDYMKDESLLVWDSDDVCKRSCMLAGDECHDCHDCCTGGEGGKPRSDCKHR